MLPPVCCSNRWKLLCTRPWKTWLGSSFWETAQVRGIPKSWWTTSGLEAAWRSSPSTPLHKFKFNFFFCSCFSFCRWWNERVPAVVHQWSSQSELIVGVKLLVKSKHFLVFFVALDSCLLAWCFVSVSNKNYLCWFNSQETEPTKNNKRYHYYFSVYCVMILKSQCDDCFHSHSLSIWNKQVQIFCSEFLL